MQARTRKIRQKSHLPFAYQSPGCCQQKAFIAAKLWNSCVFFQNILDNIDIVCYTSMKHYFLKNAGISAING